MHSPASVAQVWSTAAAWAELCGSYTPGDQVGMYQNKLREESVWRTICHTSLKLFSNLLPLFQLFGGIFPFLVVPEPRLVQVNTHIVLFCLQNSRLKERLKASLRLDLCPVSSWKLNAPRRLLAAIFPIRSIQWVLTDCSSVCMACAPGVTEFYHECISTRIKWVNVLLSFIF